MKISGDKSTGNFIGANLQDAYKMQALLKHLKLQGLHTPVNSGDTVSMLCLHEVVQEQLQTSWRKLPNFQSSWHSRLVPSLHLLWWHFNQSFKNDKHEKRCIYRPNTKNLKFTA